MILLHLLILCLVLQSSVTATLPEFNTDLQQDSPTGSYSQSLESDEDIMTGVGDGTSFRSTQSEQPVLNNSSTQIDEPSEQGAPGVVATTPHRIRNLLLEESNRLRALEANQVNAPAATPPSFFRNSDALVLVDLLLTAPLLAVIYYGKDNIEATYACFVMAPIVFFSRALHQMISAKMRRRQTNDCLFTSHFCILLSTYIVTYMQNYAINISSPENQDATVRRNILTYSTVSLGTNALVSAFDIVWIGEDFHYRWKQRPTPQQNA